MSRVKIINLTDKTFVINSLKIRVLPRGSEAKIILRDPSIKDDPDVQELENLGYISIVDVADQAAPAEPPKPADVAEKVTKAEPVQPPEKPASKRMSRKERIRMRRQAKKNSEREPAVTHDDMNSPENRMGASVVIMGENGPVKKAMNPGLHHASDPKFIQDGPPENEDEDEPLDERFIKIT